MGCKGSKASSADEAAEHANKEVAQSWDELEKAPDHHHAHVEEAAYGSARGSTQFDAAVVSKLLTMMGASKEQMGFFDVWAKHVHDEAIAQASEGGQHLFISTDLRYLEVRVTAESQLVQRLLRTFVSKIRDLPSKSMDELDMVLDALQANMDDTPVVTVWCKFKHCRSDVPPPSVDCGYLINQDLQWAVIDVMMPSHEDQDALRNYALGEKHLPVLYGCSILPISPERMLGFELSETAAANSRQILLMAFFFFKALGLMKPEDRVVRILNSCRSEKLVVCAGLGPEGLVRLALTLIEPKNPDVARELADELAFQYREREIDEIYSMLGGAPNLIDYVGETKGYGIRLGFIA